MATQGQAPASSGAVTPAPAASNAPVTPEARIQAMLDRETAPPPKKDAQQGDADYQPTGNRQVEGEGEEQEESATETQEEPEQQAQEEETREIAEIPLEQFESIQLEVTIKGDDGKDVVDKPTIKELKEGYMRTKDYSRKTAEVARQREELGEKVRQGIEGQRNQYVQDLQVLQATLLETAAPELKNVDWNALAQSDAFEYVRLQNRANQITQANASIQAKIKDATDKIAAEQKVAKLTRATKAREQLEQDIPGWNDTLYHEIMKSGEQYGFKMDEVAEWVDPRSIKVLHDAAQYRKMKAEVKPPPTGKKVVIPPKVLKPGNANNGQQRQQKQEAVKRLQSSGSIDDAAAVIRGRM